MLYDYAKPNSCETQISVNTKFFHKYNYLKQYVAYRYKETLEKTYAFLNDNKNDDDKLIHTLDSFSFSFFCFKKNFSYVMFPINKYAEDDEVYEEEENENDYEEEVYEEEVDEAELYLNSEY